MTSLNFDTDGQLGSMELYSLQLQKIVADFTDFDAVTKAYVDTKVLQAKQELTDGASSALDTFRELEDYLTASGVAGGLVEQINALSTQITAEASRAGTEEGKLDARITSLETSSVSANLQTELDSTQTGAGLDHNGSYVTDPTKHYIQTASSLYEADSWLDYHLKEEEKKREEETGSLRTDLDAQVSSQQATQAQVDADLASIQSDITTATADRVAIRSEFGTADTTLQSNIDAEATSRATADTTLQANIDAEATARVTAVNDEINARFAADSALQTSIDAEVAARTAAVTELENSVNTDFDTMQASLDTVESDYKAADTLLSGQLSALSTSATDSISAAAVDRAAIRTEFAASDVLLNTSIATLTATQASDKSAADADRATIRSDLETADTEIKQATFGFKQSTWPGDGTLKYDAAGANYPPIVANDGSIADHLFQVDSQVFKHNNLIGSTDNDDRLSFTPAFNPPAYLRDDQEQKSTIAQDVTTGLQNIATHTKSADDALTVRIAEQETKQATDDANAATALADLTADVETQVGAERTRAEGEEGALSSRVEVFEEGLNNGMQPDGEYYQENLGVQAVVNDLRGGIDYVNGQRESDKAVADSRHTASEEKHTASDGRHDGHDDRHDGHDTAITGLANDKFDKAGGQISGEVRVNLDASYFYLSPVWRIRTDAVGKRIVFEFNKDVTAYEGEGDWVSGIPFISSH